MALGIRQMGVPLGGGVAAIALPLLAGASGLRAALLALAIGCAVAAAAAAAWMREAPPPPPGRPRVQAPPPVRDARLWRLASGSALLVLAQSGILGFVVLFLHDERGWSAAGAAAALAIVQVGGAVARVVAGRWSDRLEVRIEPLRRLGLAGAGLLAITVVLAHAPIVLLLPVLLAAGVFAMSWNGLSFTAAAEMSGRDRAGTAIGVQNTVLTAAGVVAPVSFGVAVTLTSWPVAWAALALSQLAGVRVLRPLVAEEEERRAARERRLRAHEEGRRHGSATLSRITEREKI
jgi:predicted MFS family arabinose efflux permease